VRIRLVLFLWLLANVVVGTLCAAEDDSILDAISAYTEALQSTNPEHRRNGFLLAEQLFRQIAEGNEHQPAVHNSKLYLNIGNAALQNERLGPAIAAYRDSLLVNPSNSSAQQNLWFARSLLPDWIRNENESNFVDSLFFWTNSLSLLDLELTAAISFAVGVLFFCIGVSLQNAMLRNSSSFPILLWMVLLVSVYGKSWNAPDTDLVILQEATLFSADTENSSPRISKPLPDGAEIELLQDRGRWLEVQVPDNISGWILRSNVAHIDD
jgi:tetratricopeptide (TPR) repeat protein